VTLQRTPQNAAGIATPDHPIRYDSIIPHHDSDGVRAAQQAENGANSSPHGVQGHGLADPTGSHPRR